LRGGGPIGACHEPALAVERLWKVGLETAELEGWKEGRRGGGDEGRLEGGRWSLWGKASGLQTRSPYCGVGRMRWGRWSRVGEGDRGIAAGWKPVLAIGERILVGGGGGLC